MVCPPVAAAVLGTVLGIDWKPALRAHLADLAAAPQVAAEPSGQLVLSW